MNPEKKAARLRLHRVTVPGDSARGSNGYTYYTADNGRFEISRGYSRMGRYWQIQTRDGSTPFRGFARSQSMYFNADTLTECRDELEGILNYEP